MSNTKMIEKLDEIVNDRKCGGHVRIEWLREILLADDSQQRIEELERRVAGLELQEWSVYQINKRLGELESKSGGIKNNRFETLKKRVAELEYALEVLSQWQRRIEEQISEKKDDPAVCTCDPASLRTGFHLIDCPTRNKPEPQIEPVTPSEPSKDDGQTPREAALEVAELLWSIGWASPNDAQTKRLEKALGEIKTILVRSYDQKDKVAISRKDAEKWLDSYIHGEERRFNDYSFAATIRQALGEK